MSYLHCSLEQEAQVLQLEALAECLGHIISFPTVYLSHMQIDAAISEKQRLEYSNVIKPKDCKH